MHSALNPRARREMCTYTFPLTFNALAPLHIVRPAELPILHRMLYLPYPSTYVSLLKYLSNVRRYTVSRSFVFAEPHMNSCNITSAY